MNIDTFRPTALNKFLDFCEQANIDSPSLSIVEEDWDNMCGIVVESLGTKTCFCFWSDGTFRCLIDCVDP